MITLRAGQSLWGSATASSVLTCTVDGADTIGTTDAFGIVFQGVLTNAAAQLVAAGSSQQIIIKTIFVANPTGSDAGAAFYENGGSAANATVPNVLVPAGGFAIYESGSGWSRYDSNGTRLAALPPNAVTLNAANAFSNVQTDIPVRANIAGAVSINLSNASASTGTTPVGTQPTASNVLFLTATANVTSLAVIGGVDGAFYYLHLIGGGFTWPAFPASFDFGAAGAPTLTTTAGADNYIPVQYNAVTGKYRAVASVG